MSFVGKQRWGSVMNKSFMGCSLHGGSAPSLLSPSCPEGFGTLKKRFSMDILHGFAPDLSSLSTGLNLRLSPMRWPSVATVCKWKQTLMGKLKKRHFGTEDESQVRKLVRDRGLKTGHLSYAVRFLSINFKCFYGSVLKAFHIENRLVCVTVRDASWTPMQLNSHSSGIKTTVTPKVCCHMGVNWQDRREKQFQHRQNTDNS